mmetsp:Transcript_25315/g.60841  ORF Transcript_25315/g.60841 Transcript_25315/m.60841 type:complete len:233 (-) Transcript_25315:356-1054(-)
MTIASSCHGNLNTNFPSPRTMGVHDSWTCVIQSRSGTSSTLYRGPEGQWKVYRTASTMVGTSSEGGKCAETSHRFQRLRPAARSGMIMAHSSPSSASLNSSSFFRRSLEQGVREGSSNRGRSSSVSASESVMETEHAPISIRNSDRLRASSAFLGDASSSSSSSSASSSPSGAFSLLGADRPRKVICRSAQESSATSSSSCKSLLSSFIISVDSLDAVCNRDCDCDRIRGWR